MEDARIADGYYKQRQEVDEYETKHVVSYLLLLREGLERNTLLEVGYGRVIHHFEHQTLWTNKKARE